MRKKVKTNIKKNVFQQQHVCFHWFQSRQHLMKVKEGAVKRAEVNISGPKKRYASHILTESSLLHFPVFLSVNL